MSESKSFWNWVVGGIGKGSYDILCTLHKYWYGIFICFGGAFSMASSILAWLEYAYPSPAVIDGVWQYPEPMIKLWMVLYPSTCFIVFMIGLYGHWRKEVRR